MENHATLRPPVGISQNRRAGMTYVEILVILAIFSLLMALLLPALGTGFKEGEVARCLANLREIASCTTMYHVRQGRKTIPWYVIPPYEGYNPNVVTPWVFGGFKAPNPDDSMGFVMDSAVYPADIRPLNKVAAPEARGDDIIDLYICPADRAYSRGIIGAPWGGDPIVSVRSSWEANGTSYSLNTRFMQGYALPSGGYPSGSIQEYTERIARHWLGGEASKFIVWVEQGFYSATYSAGPTPAGIGGGPPPRWTGWHGRFSNWSVGFADGHARYGYYDTRTIYGLGGTIWEPNYRHGL